MHMCGDKHMHASAKAHGGRDCSVVEHYRTRVCAPWIFHKGAITVSSRDTPQYTSHAEWRNTVGSHTFDVEHCRPSWLNVQPSDRVARAATKPPPMLNLPISPSQKGYQIVDPCLYGREGKCHSVVVFHNEEHREDLAHDHNEKLRLL